MKFSTELIVKITSWIPGNGKDNKNYKSMLNREFWDGFYFYRCFTSIVVWEFDAPLPESNPSVVGTVYSINFHYY